MKLVRIVSLGEIVTQNQLNTVKKLAGLVSPDAPQNALSILGNLLQQVAVKNSLEQFKLGLKEDEEFTQEMVAAIKHATSIELTCEAFNEAWSLMNPDFSDYGAQLLEVIAENHKAKQKIILLSFSNPKDINQLVTDLKKNGVEYTQNANNQLNSIGGVPLYLTYVEKKSKADLIEQIIQEHKGEKKAVANDITFFKLKAVDIKYVRGTQGIPYESLKKLNDKNIQEVQEKIESMDVETLFWNKKEQSFSAAIHGEEAFLLARAHL